MEVQEYSDDKTRTGAEAFALDTIPDSSNAGVKDWLKKIPRLFMVHQIILLLGVVGRYQHIAASASARDAETLVKAQDALFNIIKAIDAVSLMLQSFQSGANNILEKLRVSYLYLLDGFPDFAKTDIEAIAKDVQSMKASTEKALGVVADTEKSMQYARKFLSSKNGRDAQLAPIKQALEELSGHYRRVSEELKMVEGSSDEKLNLNKLNDSGTQKAPMFLDFLKENTIAFFKDWISLAITVGVFVSFYVCDCKFYNTICGWVTLSLGMLLFLLRFSLIRVIRPKHVDYKPVIPLTIVGLILVLFPCQLLLLCDFKCFVVIAILPLATIGVMFAWFLCAPNHWFFAVQTSSNYIPLYTKGSARSLENMRDELQLIRDEQLEKEAEKQNIEAAIGNAELTNCFLGKAVSDLKSVSGIIQQSTGVVEIWYNECKDIVEPNMDRTIRKAKDVPEEELEKYWNSMAFKKEVVGYYYR
jgi:hypothetical protein